jgi:hypothetical protein
VTIEEQPDGHMRGLLGGEVKRKQIHYRRAIAKIAEVTIEEEVSYK